MMFSYFCKVLSSNSLKLFNVDILRSAASQAGFLLSYKDGTITHFIFAAFAAIIPLKESSKQMHDSGCAFNF